jgi:hypothetical protein
VTRTKLFSTSERAPSHFVPKAKLAADGATTTTASTTLTTSTTTAPLPTDETTRRKPFGKDLLASIPVEDDVSALLPEGYVLKPETTSVGIVQVSMKLWEKFMFYSTRVVPKHFCCTQTSL